MSLGDISILFAILASVGGGLAILFGLDRWRNRRDAGLLRAAGRLGGMVPDSEGLEFRQLQFSIEGRPASIEYQQGEEDLTRVKVSMSRRSPGVFRILRQDIARANARFFGWPDLKVGDPYFDRAWVVTARPESLVRRIFSEDRRDQVIDSVRRLNRFGAPSIEITRDTLIVRVGGLLQDESDLFDLAQTAIDFVGYLLRLGPEEGIAWVATDDADPGLCPVCAAPMTEAVVSCDKCKTPHHEECWRYVGQCSTYACKGKRFGAGPVSGHDPGAAAS
jgi:hypothetical protein